MPQHKESSQTELEVSRSWVIYDVSIDEITNIQKEIDEICSGYSFYPEIDWRTYQCKPPEGLQVYGAWRHPRERIYVFLLDNPTIITVLPETSLLLRIIGHGQKINRLISGINSLKGKFVLAEKKNLSDRHVDERIDRFYKSKSLTTLFVFLALFTAIINAWATYLRKIDPPVTEYIIVTVLYKWSIIAVHSSAILLLLLVIAICAILLLKYGIMLVRRL
ncbi:MAG: hypothetical protein A2V66_08000 [Ignavibacteria bacterium RBG_13_36_8]|nr:MAG: hypothetical protein A2V66_08000 [Ignavibacteria bacterium RBG_13_36_8]